MNIDEIAEDVVNQFSEEVYLYEKYTGWNRDTLLQSTLEDKRQAIKEMLHQMDYDEGMFSVVEHPYMVAKSLYLMLTEDSLSDEEKISAVKLCYFCLLKNYLKNKDEILVNYEFGDLISGCKLALVLISMQAQYLMLSVIMGQAQYIDPQTHIKNQILLFGGVIKEAENIVDTDRIWPMEAVIKDYYEDVYKELNGHFIFPIGRELAMHKERCIPIIKNIVTSISVNLKDSPDFDF